MSLNYRLFPEHIRRLFGSMVQEEKDLDHWHHDMMGQTMLIYQKIWVENPVLKGHLCVSI
ncbi:hypothetical protein [Aetokthonos hydrillicola]|uniref:hypothetical protein n=1 Tax=Aetokthonos hydrillicola TaxID=1550245 RepID=UPI001ABB5191